MSKYIKNARATKGASHYIQKVQEALVSHGAVGIQMMFDDEARISAISFALPRPDGEGLMSFQLPCQWRKFQEVLRQQDFRRWDEDEYCYKVAWANIKDWVEAQMTFYETEMVTMPQVFLPFAVTKNGQTLSEVISNNPNRLLGSGDDNENG